MTTTAPLTIPTPTTPPALLHDRPPTRRRGDDLRTLPAVLLSEWIKLSTLRSNRVVLALAVGVSGFAAWAVATLVTDEVLTVAEVYVYPTLLVAVLAAVAGILLFSSEAQHGTLAGTLTARPTRWLTAVAKTVAATGSGLVLGAVGMAAGAGGAALGGLAVGDTSTMVSTTAAALLYTALAGMLGLGVGMVARHSAAAISGLLVWWFVVENLVLVFAPVEVARFLPFDAGYRILEVGSDFDTPEMLAAALTRPQYAVVFAAYAVAAVAAGTVSLHHRDVG